MSHPLSFLQELRVVRDINASLPFADPIALPAPHETSYFHELFPVELDDGDGPWDPARLSHNIPPALYEVG
jgi:hypothetical protein